ncbi:MAG: tetratricopeptide repeat protein, partial [Algicola sp.]|nr:tetratricopeptide repeat protein [Algicola sp.]
NTVRMATVRVRKKLQQFYQSPAGQQSMLQITLPKGSNKAVFEPCDNALRTDPEVISSQLKVAADKPLDNLAIIPKLRSRKGLMAVAVMLMLLLLMVAWFKGSPINIDAQQQALHQLEVSLAKKSQQLGQHEFDKEDYQQALTHFQKAAQFDPDNSQYLRNIIKVHLQLGNYQRVKELLEKALLVDSASRNASSDIVKNWMLFGRYYVGLSQYTSALNCFNKALEIADSINISQTIRANIYINRASVRVRFEDFDLATEDLDRAYPLAQKHQLPYFYWMRGRILILQGTIIEAIPHYTRALELSTQVHGEQHSLANVHRYNLAGLYRRLGEFDKALKYFHQTLALKIKVVGENSVTLGSLYNSLAVVYMDQQNYQKSELYFDKALKINRLHLPPNSLKIALNLYNLAGLNRRQEKYQQAQESLHQALAIYSEHYGNDHWEVADVWQQLGHVNKAQGNVEVARRYYQKALPIYLRVYGNNKPQSIGLRRAIAELDE